MSLSRDRLSSRWNPCAKASVTAGSEYRRTLAALRQALDDIGRYPLDEADRVVLATVRDQVDKFDHVHGEISTLIRSGTRDDELAASTKVLEVGGAARARYRRRHRRA
jgi:hypothetical protein